MSEVKTLFMRVVPTTVVRVALALMVVCDHSAAADAPFGKAGSQRSYDGLSKPLPAPVPTPAPGPTPAPTPATPLSKPLDTTTATAAYSFRQLKSAYQGSAVQLRRELDNQLADIGFVNGNFDSTRAVNFCAATACFVSRFYDQSGNANTLEQTVNANQPRYVASGSPNGFPVARWCATCGMKAADSPTYKTPDVHGFMVVKIGLPSPSGSPTFMIVGYPRSATSDLTDLTWGISNQGYADVLQFQIYGPGGYNNGSENPYGFGAAYRGQLFQYDFDTANRILKYNTTLFLDGSDGTVNYANPVGLVVGMDANGQSNMVNGEFSELILFGSTQITRDTISRNQSAYWGIANLPAEVITADGYRWTPFYTGNFGGAGGPLAGKLVNINGRKYFSESAWDKYSIWQAQNVATGRDLMRFEVRRGDVDNITGAERSELDGAAEASWRTDTTVQISYAVLVEPGAVIADASWLSLGQFHYDNAVYPPTSFSIDLANDVWRVMIDGAANPVSVYSSVPMLRNKWYDFFVEQKISSTGAADLLKVWIDGVNVVDLSGNLFPHGRQGGYWKYGIYRGYTVIEPLAVRYSNMEVADKAVTDLGNRIASPLPHP
jgi:Polysaccharide lyase/Alpha-L-arabinofuranosidase B, catalytic